MSDYPMFEHVSRVRGFTPLIEDEITQRGTKHLWSQDEMLTELKECLATLKSLIGSRPQLSAVQAGSTTVGNRRAQLAEVIRRATAT